MSNTQGKRAVVLCAVDMLSQFAGILDDSELIIVGTAESERGTFTAKIIIEGDSLPDECKSGLKIVTLIVRTERYGKQTISRIHEIRIAPQ